MKLVYENTPVEMGEFAMYQLSPAARMCARWQQPLIFSLFALLGFVLVGGRPTLIEFLVVALLFLTVGFAIWSWYLNRAEQRFFDKLDHSGTTGLHELELTDGTLIERTSVNASSHRLGSIHKIVERPEHYLIYLTPMLAHIVPKGRIQNGNLDAFLDELCKRTELTITAE